MDKIRIGRLEKTKNKRKNLRIRREGMEYNKNRRISIKNAIKIVIERIK